MKKLVLLVAAIVILFQMPLKAQYNEAMKSALSDVQNAKSPEDFKEVVNTFVRISENETSEWLPEYYAAYFSTIQTFFTQDNKEKDKLLEQATKFVENADKKSPDNSEIYVLKAFINTISVSVDPMNRGYKLAAKTGEYLGIAKKLNIDNPRIYLIEGQTVYYTPEQFGGGKEKAYQILKTGKEKYEKFVPKSDIEPNWGKDQLEKMLSGYAQK